MIKNEMIVSLPMGTLMVRTQGADTTPSAGGPSDRKVEIIPEYDSDPVVKAYIHNVTSMWGYTSRTEVEGKHYSADFKGINVTQDSYGVFEIVKYTYRNVTTNYRFRFMAATAVDANGKAIPPKRVFPGEELPPLSEKNPDAECWYWYLLIGIAVIAVIAAIVAQIAIAAAGGIGGGGGYYDPMLDKFDMPEGY